MSNQDSNEGGITLLNQENMRRNFAAVDQCRTAVSVIGGATAGTLGLTGLNGFLFFIVTVAILASLLCIRSGNNWKQYFMNRFNPFVMSSIFSSAFLYVVFWTFFYGLVNVY